MNNPLWLTFPNTKEQILLLTQVIFVCMLGSYYLASDPVANLASQTSADEQTGTNRTKQFLIVFGLGLTTFFLPGFNTTLLLTRLFLSLLVLAFLLLLPLLRLYLARSTHEVLRRHTGESEIIANGLLLLATSILISSSSLQVYSEDTLVILPFPSPVLSSAFLTLSAIIFLADGGTYVVRGILNKTGSVPKKKTTDKQEDGGSSPPPLVVLGNGEERPTVIDNKEYARGKYIGTLERLLVLAVTIVGSYETIGFIIAGKGLIRAKEFEDRDFAEYFLIGTLTSTALAVVVGLILKTVIGKIMLIV